MAACLPKQTGTMIRACLTCPKRLGMSQGHVADAYSVLYVLHMVARFDPRSAHTEASGGGQGAAEGGFRPRDHGARPHGRAAD